MSGRDAESSHRNEGRTRLNHEGGLIMKRSLFLAVALLIAAHASPTKAQNQTDRDGVRQAVLDYVEGVYNVDPSRIERSVHPKLAKTGFYRGPKDEAYRPGS